MSRLLKKSDLLNEAQVAIYIDQAIVPSTLTTYQLAWTRWLDYCRTREIVSLPASPGDVSNIKLRYKLKSQRNALGVCISYRST